MIFDFSMAGAGTPTRLRAPFSRSPTQQKPAKSGKIFGFFLS